VNFILRLPSCKFTLFAKQFLFKMSAKQRFIFHFLHIHVESKRRISQYIALTTRIVAEGHYIMLILYSFRTGFRSCGLGYWACSVFFDLSEYIKNGERKTKRSKSVVRVQLLLYSIILIVIIRPL